MQPELQDLWVLQVLQDQLVLQDLKARIALCQAQLVPQVQAVQQDQWATLEPPEPPEKQDPQAHAVPLALLAQLEI